MSRKLEKAEKRLLWLTGLVLVGLVAGSLRFGDWRITSGVVLGGALSFLNLYWLKRSLVALLSQATEGEQPRFSAAFYVLRYLFIGCAVAAAVSLNLVSVAATLVGLLSFAFAVLLEAFIQVYLIIVKREED